MRDLHYPSTLLTGKSAPLERHDRCYPVTGKRISGIATHIGKRSNILKSAQPRQMASSVSGSAERLRGGVCIIMNDVFRTGARKAISSDQRRKSGDCLIAAAEFIAGRTGSNPEADNA